MSPGSEHPETYDRSFSDLLKELVEGLSVLVRQEIALARTEMSDKAKLYLRASAMMIVAAVVALFALGVLTACIILALHLVLAAWLAALIVGVAYLLVTVILVLVGRARLKQAGRPVPEQTIETIKEDVSWAKHRARSATT
jgi:hypothetical protein